jgi:hypothetical protein
MIIYISCALGFEAKKIIATRNSNAQDLSINNVVTIKGSETYPHRPNAGITLPQSVDDEVDVAGLKFM